jgi:hypothetical protein
VAVAYLVRSQLGPRTPPSVRELCSFEPWLSIQNMECSYTITVSLPKVAYTDAEASDAGLIDAIVEGDLRSDAVAFARRVTDEKGFHRKTRELRAETKLGTSLEEVLRAGRDLAQKIKRNQNAPLKAVEAIGASVLPFEEGCRRERELFHECATSEQCRALIHAFFAEGPLEKLRALANRLHRCQFPEC